MALLVGSRAHGEGLARWVGERDRASEELIFAVLLHLLQPHSSSGAMMLSLASGLKQGYLDHGLHSLNPRTEMFPSVAFDSG